MIKFFINQCAYFDMLAYSAYKFTKKKHINDIN